MLLQEFRDSGLIWLANRALHPFGVAIAVAAYDGPGPPRIAEEQGLRLVRTSDPSGFAFSEAEEDESRERFFAWLSGRPRTSAPLSTCNHEFGCNCEEAKK